jgi:hypothetical protein
LPPVVVFAGFPNEADGGEETLYPGCTVMTSGRLFIGIGISLAQGERVITARASFSVQLVKALVAQGPFVTVPAATPSTAANSPTAAELSILMDRPP